MPEVDPAKDPREEPYFHENARQLFRTELAERFGAVTLAGDLAGVYLNVKEGLLDIPEHSGQTPSHVIWGWTFGFENDCGRHATSAIGGLHSLLFGDCAVS